MKRRALAVVANFVVQARASYPPDLKARAEFDALGGLQAKERMRETPVELAIPLHVAAESDRKPRRDHLDYAAQRVAGFFARVDLFDDRALGDRIGNPHLRFFRDAPQVRATEIVRRFNLGCADTHDVAQHVNSEWPQKLHRERADRDARRSLTRRRALEHIANIVKIVFEHARQIRVSRTRPRDHLGLARIGRIRGHSFFPVLEIAIGDDERDRTAHRAPEADSRDRTNLVLFDQHPAAAAVAFLAARELMVDACEIDLEAGGYALDHRDEFGAVRFTGGQKTEHRIHSPSRPRSCFAGASRFNHSGRWLGSRVRGGCSRAIRE